MEPTITRLDRILKGLQHALTVCNNEVGGITSQILVREDALNLLETDTVSLREQYEKFEDALHSLKQKNSVVDARIRSSQKEIDDLTSKINVLKPSASDNEVQEIIDRYTASIHHHEDVLNIAKSELNNDQQKQEEIKQAMEKLMAELNKKPNSHIDEQKISEEIRQLKESLAKLDETRDQIVQLINTLDPNRIEGTGESIILHESEQAKKKLDDHFVRTPQSGGGRAKRMRPETPKKRSYSDFQMDDESTTTDIDVNNVHPGPALFAPFLPTTAAKLLSVVDGRFDSIEWYAQTAKVPMNEDIANVPGSWTTVLQTHTKHFLLQKYKSLFFGSESYRVIAIDPHAVVHDPSTNCVPLAFSKNYPQTKLLLDQLGILEDVEKFDYENVWRLLSKDS